jgi:hypothetical protein
MTRSTTGLSERCMLCCAGVGVCPLQVHMPALLLPRCVSSACSKHSSITTQGDSQSYLGSGLLTQTFVSTWEVQPENVVLTREAQFASVCPLQVPTPALLWLKTVAQVPANPAAPLPTRSPPTRSSHAQAAPSLSSATMTSLQQQPPTSHQRIWTICQPLSQEPVKQTQQTVASLARPAALPLLPLRLVWLVGPVGMKRGSVGTVQTHLMQATAQGSRQQRAGVRRGQVTSGRL